MPARSAVNWDYFTEIPPMLLARACQVRRIVGDCHLDVVTGATGHIGNVLVRELLERGHVVRALVLPGEDVSPLDGLDAELVIRWIPPEISDSQRVESERDPQSAKSISEGQSLPPTREEQR